MIRIILTTDRDLTVMYLTHISLVLEGVLTARSVAVEVGCLLVPVHAVLGVAVLRPPEPEESLPLDCIVLPVVVEMHLDVGGADVDFVTAVTLNAVVVGLLLVVGAVNELVTAVVHRSDPSEPVLQGLVHLLVPLAVSDHLLLLGEVLPLAHGDGAVEMFPVVHVFTPREAALQAGAEPLEVAGVVRRHQRLPGDEAVHPLGGQEVGWEGVGQTAMGWR